MDETDIMDLTHQKARKRPRPISSVDESVHASLKRLPIRATECREPSLMFAVRGDPVPAASLKQNDHSVTSSPTTVMPTQVNAQSPILSGERKRKRKKNWSLVVDLSLLHRSESEYRLRLYWMQCLNRWFPADLKSSVHIIHIMFPGIHTLLFAAFYSALKPRLVLFFLSMCVSASTICCMQYNLQSSVAERERNVISEYSLPPPQTLSVWGKDNFVL